MVHTPPIMKYIPHNHCPMKSLRPFSHHRVRNRTLLKGAKIEETKSVYMYAFKIVKGQYDVMGLIFCASQRYH